MTCTPHHRHRRRLGRGEGRRQDGTVSLMMVLFMTVFVALLAMAVDIGGAWVRKTHAHGTAAEAGRAAVDQLAEDGAYSTGDLRAVNPGKARQAACDLVSQVEPGATCTATINGQGEVTVEVSDPYDSLMLGVVGVRQIPVKATALVRPAIGADSDTEVAN